MGSLSSDDGCGATMQLERHKWSKQTTVPADDRALSKIACASYTDFHISIIPSKPAKPRIISQDIIYELKMGIGAKTDDSTIIPLQRCADLIIVTDTPKGHISHRTRN